LTCALAAASLVRPTTLRKRAAAAAAVVAVAAAAASIAGAAKMQQFICYTAAIYVRVCKVTSTIMATTTHSAKSAAEGPSNDCNKLCRLFD
jgi:hypothetical protein